MNPAEIIKRIDELITKGNEVLTTKDKKYVNQSKFRGFRTSSLSFLEKLFGTAHTFYKEFDAHVNFHRISSTEIGIEILLSAKNEVESGWFFSIKKLISSNIFSDFLEMADYLLNDGGYKDAAAVMIGSVLEEHLRQLCVKHGISVDVVKGTKTSPKKASAINDELAGASAYGKQEQKSITAWLDLRNDAAHGNYSKYNSEQVKTMSMGVSEFISRVTI